MMGEVMLACLIVVESCLSHYQSFGAYMASSSLCQFSLAVNTWCSMQDSLDNNKTVHFLERIPNSLTLSFILFYDDKFCNRKHESPTPR